ncbi:ER-Golgi SNARE complex subunit [Reticulomyxa filosa]|uniref:ER-Golgi SNARE complex subunit n=1 Tax=Reticulomyxa filosa TaxID=46433 RepID=X6N464_RETFI|nr:ER-Golgi SNARE complex subunit [Reticulomyxa filosa]|eukprot:ETO20703.1 ER-Golgi SNARE complex subunit [Reticulomyxa filosa]
MKGKRLFLLLLFHKLLRNNKKKCNKHWGKKGKAKKKKKKKKQKDKIKNKNNKEEHSNLHSLFFKLHFPCQNRI